MRKVLYAKIPAIQAERCPALPSKHRTIIWRYHPDTPTPVYQRGNVPFRNLWGYHERNPPAKLHKPYQEKQPLYVLVIHEELYGGF